MRRFNVVLAAAAVFCGSAALLRAEPLQTANSTGIAATGVETSQAIETSQTIETSRTMVQAQAAASPAIAPPAPLPSAVAGARADAGVKAQRQDVKSDPVASAVPAIRTPSRTAAHHPQPVCHAVRHHPHHRAKLAWAGRMTAPPAAIRFAASNEPQKVVLLGVGY